MSRLTGLTVALVLAATSAIPAPALALTKPEAAATWVARTNAFTGALDDPTTNNDNVLGRQREACKGLTGERMRIGGYAPIWAAEGQASFCKALDGFHGAITVKNPCGELKKARGYFAKAKPFGDSEAVVPASEKMVAMIDRMLSGAQNAGLRRC